MPKISHLVQLLAIFCLHASFINAITYYMPEFEELPPPLVYVSRSLKAKVTCRGWSATSNSTTVQIFFTQGSGDNIAGRITSHAPALYPLPNDWRLTDEGPGQISLPIDNSILDSLKNEPKRFYCLVKTDFGSLLSRPFQVLESYIQEFPNSLSGLSAAAGTPNDGIVPINFLGGNVAYFDCPSPPSQPPATLRFRLAKNSQYLLANDPSDRYRYLEWTNGGGITLLIKNVEVSDAGDYECEATNPKTLDKVYSPWKYRLHVQMPDQRIQVRIRRPLYGSEMQQSWRISDSSDTSSMNRYKSTDGTTKVISLREGQNASLFCIMEGAPPPTITIYRSTYPNKVSDNRRTSRQSDDYGIWSITRAQVQDGGKYFCQSVETSAPHASEVLVKIIRNLTIVNPPENQALNDLTGATVKFTCSADAPPSSSSSSAAISDTNSYVQPHRLFWYKNGHVITQENSNDGSLILENIQEKDLGIYQCVVVSKNEWVSRHALLYLKDDTILTKADVTKKNQMNTRDLSPGSKNPDNNKNKPNNDKLNPPFKRDRQTREISKPTTTTFFFNLAVLIMWNVSSQDLESNFYNIEKREASKSSISGRVSEWGQPSIVLERIANTNVFLTEAHGLRGGEIYQFRVVMIKPQSQMEIASSPWSSAVSFTHIGPIAPDIVQHKINDEGNLEITCNYAGQATFPITHFSVLSRPEKTQNSNNKQKREALSTTNNNNQGKRSQKNVQYGMYQNTTVLVTLDNQQSQVIVIKNLKGEQRYQVGVLGQAWDRVRGRLRYTRLSKEFHINMPPTKKPESTSPELNSTESHYRMILIVTIACSITFFVIFILLILCAFHTCIERKQSRQRREEWLMSITEPQCGGGGNGGVGHGSNSATIYKDPAKLLHRENSLLLRYPPPALSPNGSISQHQAATLLNHTMGSQSHLSNIHHPANSSSFMLASLNAQQQQQQQQQQHLATANSRFQSLQRMPSSQHPHPSHNSAYQMTSTLSMMKREPPSGGDSIHDHMDGSGPGQEGGRGGNVLTQSNANERGTLYHRGGVNSLAGSRLMLPHANSPPIVSPMAQAMSLQALNMAVASSNNTPGNNRDSMLIQNSLLPQAGYLTTSRQNSTGTPISPQQQQWIAWQQQQQAMAAAMLGYPNPNLVNSWSNNAATSPEMYYAAAAHALRMQQQANAAAAAAAASGMDGNESVYSYFSQPVQHHGQLDSPSAAYGAQASYFHQQMGMMQQPMRPGSVQPPPTLQEQEEDSLMPGVGGIGSGGMQSGGNGETMPSQHSTNTSIEVGSQAASTTGSVSGRPPSNHHHHHRRRRRKQASASNATSGPVSNGLQGMMSLNANNSGTVESSTIMNDGGGGGTGERGVGAGGNSNLGGPNNNGGGWSNHLGDGTHDLGLSPPVSNMLNHGGGGGGGDHHVSHYQPKYVNHGSFPPPPTSQGPTQPYSTSVPPGASHHNHHPFHNSLTRRGTPTLFVEPPRMRDYSEYGIPPNQVASAAPSDLDEANFEESNNDWVAASQNENTSGNRLSSSYLPPPPPRA